MMRSVHIIVAMVAIIAFTMAVRTWSGTLAPVPASEGSASLVDPLGEAFHPPPSGLVRTGASVGLLLLIAYLAGRLATQWRLAAVTGYLAIGVVVGPSALGVVGAHELPYLALVNDLAIALIALIAGGEIRLAFLRTRWRAVSIIASVEALGVLVGTAALLPIVLVAAGVIDDARSVTALALAVVCATIAIANSPAVVIAVISELNEHGPMSRLALAVTVCKDLMLVVVFTIVLAVASGVLLQQADQSALAVAWSLTLHLGGSIAAGALVGVGMAWYMHTIRVHLPFLVIFACFGIALASEALGFEALIVAIVAGLLMQNVWPRETKALFEELEQISLPVYCVFFAVAGLRVDLDSLASIWVWAVLFVLARGVLVWLSTLLAIRLARTSPHETRWLWTAFTPQAGIALALASIVEQTLRTEPFAARMFNFLVAVIAINQLIGPVLFKFGISRSGGITAPPLDS